MTTQPLQVVNSDMTTHNIHPVPKNNREWNESQPPGSQPINQSFAREEIAIPVKCNVHPWMKSYIGVIGSPYFQVTGKDGSFTLKNVPPGTYTVAGLARVPRHPGTDGHDWPEGIQGRHHHLQGCRRIRLAHGQKRQGRRLVTAPAAIPMTSPRALRNVHRFAVFTACCTFLLLIAGALVTSNDAGLSVPDWPLSYGSLLPPMVGGIFYEHGHRMIATLVGTLSIVLAVWLWRVESRRWVRWLGVVALGAVVAQGILGGLTVLFFLRLPSPPRTRPSRSFSFAPC